MQDRSAFKPNNNVSSKVHCKLTPDVNFLSCPILRQAQDTHGERSKEIEEIGIISIDALHIACAEMAKADFFITCDDVLVRKGITNKKNLKVRIIGLMEFVAKEVFKSETDS
jgi:hypothetical protein